MELLADIVVNVPELEIPVDDKFTTIVGSVEIGVTLMLELETIELVTALANPKQEIVEVIVGKTVGLTST